MIVDEPMTASAEINFIIANLIRVGHEFCSDKLSISLKPSRVLDEYRLVVAFNLVRRRSPNVTYAVTVAFRGQQKPLVTRRRRLPWPS